METSTIEINPMSRVLHPCPGFLSTCSAEWPSIQKKSTLIMDLSIDNHNKRWMMKTYPAVSRVPTAGRHGYRWPAMSHIKSWLEFSLQNIQIFTLIYSYNIYINSGTPFEGPPWHDTNPSGKATNYCTHKNRKVLFSIPDEGQPILVKMESPYKRNTTIYTYHINTISLTTKKNLIRCATGRINCIIKIPKNNVVEYLESRRLMLPFYFTCVW